MIHSLHKTLPAMTQTALLHVQGTRVDRDRLHKYLRMLQTSSPSYVLMASMDTCIRYVESHGAERCMFMRQEYDIFCKKIDKCKHIRIGRIPHGKTRKDEESASTLSGRPERSSSIERSIILPPGISAKFCSIPGTAVCMAGSYTTCLERNIICRWRWRQRNMCWPS